MHDLSGRTLLEWADANRTYDLFRSPGDHRNPQAAWVHPTIVRGMGVVVWGHRYRPIWESEPNTLFPVLDLDDTSSPDEANTASVDELGRDLGFALTAENRPGAYRLSELDRIRSLAGRYPDADQRWRTILPLLGDGSDPSVLVERYSQLRPGLARAVDADELDLRTAEAVPASLSEAVERTLPLLSGLTYSNRRQAVRMAVELLRAGTTTNELHSGLSELSQLQIVPWLHARRYPTLSGLEDRLDAVRRRVLRGSGVQLHAPTAFEGDRYEVRFSFRSATELRTRVTTTLRLEDEIDELLDLLF